MGDEMLTYTLVNSPTQEVNLAEQLFTKKVKIVEEPRVRVVLADDNPGVRSGIRRLLAASGMIEVVGEAENGEQALRRVDELDPDVLLLDLEMPILSGHQVAAFLNQHHRRVKTLVVSAHADRQYILSVFGNGIAGYIVKEDVPGMLVNAVLRIAEGDSNWISPSAAEKLVLNSPPVQDSKELTEREQEILRLVQSGLDDDQISQRLNLDSKIVTQSVLMILAKLRICSRRELCSN